MMLAQGAGPHLGSQMPVVRTYRPPVNRTPSLVGGGVLCFRRNGADSVGVERVRLLRIGLRLPESEGQRTPQRRRSLRV